MLRATYAGFTTALSALQASQKRLDVTGHNLANMNTEGYTRQQLQVSSLNYDHPASFYMNENDVNVGFGVSIDSVMQMRDPFLDMQHRMQNSVTNYDETIINSLEGLSNFLDETNVDGLHSAFNNVKSSLTLMQDPSKVNDPVYEGELRSRMKEVTLLLNQAAIQLDATVKNEFQLLDGSESNRQGAEEEVNMLLKNIGDMNCLIKRNQILGKPCLELKDQRNVLIDELSGYIPIEVTYFKEENHEGEKSWPDDLRIDLVYQDDKTSLNKLTLIDGTNGGEGKNYGFINVEADGKVPGQSIDYKNVWDSKVKITGADGSDVTCGANPDGNDVRLGSGSIQGSVDMLSTKRYGLIRNFNDYKKDLDILARTFAKTMNEINREGTRFVKEGLDSPEEIEYFEKKSYALFNKREDPLDFDGIIGTGPLADDSIYDGITAENIVLSDKWMSGEVHVGTRGESSTDSVLNMLDAMESPFDELNNMSFSSNSNFVSTQLANDMNVTNYKVRTDYNVMSAIDQSKGEISGISLDEEASNMLTYTSAYNAAARLMTALDEVLNTLINNTGVAGR